MSDSDTPLLEQVTKTCPDENGPLKKMKCLPKQFSIKIHKKKKGKGKKEEKIQVNQNQAENSVIIKN